MRILVPTCVLGCTLMSSLAHAQGDAPAPATDASTDARQAAVSAPSITATPRARARPPLSVGRLIGEAYLGLFAGGLGGTAGAGLGALIDDARRTGDDHDLGMFILGGYLGYTASVPLGVYLGSTFGDQSGSLSLAYLGAAIGGATGALTVWAVDRTGSDSDALWGTTFGIALAAPVVGAVIGANWRREYDSDSRESKTIVPMISIQGDRSLLGVTGRL